jgi:exonuclease SbcC
LLLVWQEALASSFFEAQIDYLQAVVSLADQQKLALEISEFELRRGEIASAIKTQQEMIGEQKLPQLALLQQQLVQLQADQQNAEDQWLTIDKQLSQFKHSAAQINKAAQKNQALEARYAVVGTLSDVANGQSANKVSLQRFVLSALLDDVLIEASARLQIMSKGRYQLLRKEERAKGNKASGLELEVDDAYTGKVRPVSTLSGGESFMAALSLALGVSGVVQAHAGGIVLDTLFIDEGFGSLDSEALDLAVRTLVDLQRHGRMIGVISHVSELKEQINTRIDIISDQQGSRIQLVS